MAQRNSDLVVLAALALFAGCGRPRPEITLEIRDVTTVADTPAYPDDRKTVGRVVVSRDSAATASSSLAILLVRSDSLGDSTEGSQRHSAFVAVLLRDGRGEFEFHQWGLAHSPRWLREQRGAPLHLEFTPLGVVRLGPIPGVDFAVDHRDVRSGGRRGLVEARPASPERPYLVAYLVQHADTEYLATAVVNDGVGQVTYASGQHSSENSVLGLGHLPGEGRSFRVLGAAAIQPANRPSGMPQVQVGELRRDSTDLFLHVHATVMGDSGPGGRPALGFVSVRRLSGGDPADTITFYGYHDGLMVNGRGEITDVHWEMRPRGRRWPWSQVRVEPLGIIPLTPVSGSSVRGP